MLSAFPAEILLEIIKCLPLTTIASLPALSKSWATFMTTNESLIYCRISKRYGYTSEGGPGPVAPSEGWKAWLIHKFQTELRWIGKLPGNPYQVRVPEKNRNFYSVKVDEEAGYVITTFISGGLMVLDIHDYRILWSLEEEFCDGCTHCGYYEGYLVVNQNDDCREVWRRRVDVLDIPAEVWPSASHNKPNENMMEGHRTAENRYFDANHSRDPDRLRGHFIPWACFVIPEGSQAFALTRGTLLESSNYTAFLYDVEKGELQQTIEIETYGFGDVRDADISEQHIFIVRVLQLNVYDRATGLLVLTIPAGRESFDFHASPENQLVRAEAISNHGEIGFQAAIPGRADRDEYFHTVHVSSCGKHLAILTLSGKVTLVQDFWRLIPIFSSSTSTLLRLTLGNISKQVDFYSKRPLPITAAGGRLAYNRGKVAYVNSDGLYLLVLDSMLDQLGEIDFPRGSGSLQVLPGLSKRESPWPDLRLREVRFDGVEIPIEEIILCLQLTETKLYFSVFPKDFRDERGENMWCYDFA